jgi:hypothetical protein
MGSIGFSFSVRGWQKLAGLGKRIPPSVSIALLQGGTDVFYTVQPYAPPVPNSEYVRTYNLFNSWGVGLVSVMVVKVSNSMPYSSFVQGESQTWFHAAHGWMTVMTALAANQANIERMVKEAVDRALGGP